MSVLLVWPNSLIEARRIPVEGYLVGAERVLDLEVLAVDAASECRLGVRDAAQAGWLSVSQDAGATYVAVPAAGVGAITGPDIGPLAVGQRTPIKVKIAIPGGTALRTCSIQPVLGLGTSPAWADSSLVADYGAFTDPNAGPSPSADMGTF